MSGGRSGSAGALTSGGAGAANGGAGTAGASSGGAPVVTGGAGGAASGGRVGSGGQVGNGGQVGSGGQLGAGGKTGASCETLRMRLENLLTEAQACERTGGSFSKCSETVMTECGCSVPVNESSPTAIEEYQNALLQVKKACGTPVCPKIACQDPTPATCQTNGPSMGGHCVPSNFDTGQRGP